MWRGLLVALVMLGALSAAPYAAAQDDEDTGWTIEAFDAQLRVLADGSVEVNEEIAVDFGALERHGIFRVMPVAYPIPEGDPQVELPAGREASDFRRVLQVDGIDVESTAPADVETDHEDDDLVIRIGDPDATVTGRQTYRLRYVMRGALNAFDDRAELAWNVTGDRWPVPIRAASATVEAPAVIDGACAQGPAGATTPCQQTQVGDGRATFAAEDLAPGEGLTVTVAIPRDAVTVPPPIINERWTLPRALAGSPLALPLAAVTALLGFGGVALLARRGRDEADPGHPGNTSGLHSGPPEGLRPAQLGVLLDERIDQKALSATLMDLADRGFLDIEHVPAGSRQRKPDWRLRRRSGGDEARLLEYERHVLDALFAKDEVVTVSDLRGEFADEYQRFRDLVYTDAVDRGWFRRSPAATRARWLSVAVVALVIAGTLLGLALAFTSWAAAVVPLFLAAVALLVVHRWLPRRTPAGRRLLDQARGFRASLVSPPAPHYQPYFILFGTTTNSGDLDGFADAVGSDLSTTPSTSTSGTVSGGGFGGGGGGSW